MTKPPRKRPSARNKSVVKASSPRPKATSKTAKAPNSPKRRTDRRGTPKGKGTRVGGPGDKNSGPKPKGRIGNPPHKPTPDSRKLANDLASYGIPHWAIAEMMSISPDTLERHYAKEISLGPHRMTARAANMVAKGVLAGDKDYVKFYLARRGGPAWANKAQTEHSTPPGRPLETRDVSGLTIAQLEALAELDDGDD